MRSAVVTAGLMGTWLTLVGGACVEPRSGLHAAQWCKNAESGTDLVDDMEDGDATTCDKRGGWSVVGPAAVQPGRLSVSADLLPEDVDARQPDVSYRGHHLRGMLDAGATAALTVSLGAADLRGYDQITFWARTDGGDLMVRVNVATPDNTPIAEGGTCDPGVSTCGDQFGDDAMIAESWGDPTAHGANNVAFGAFRQEKMGSPLDVDSDLAKVLALEFRVTGRGDTVGFWIDDLRLKKKAGP